jgi:alpha-N-acetylglucosamine transferase
MKKASSSPSVIDPAFFSQCTSEEFREHIQVDGFFPWLSTYLKNNGVKTRKNRGYVLPQ